MNVIQLQPTRRVVGLSGSLRAGSWNTHLLHNAQRLAPPGMHIDLFSELGALPHFNEDIEQEAFKEGPVARLFEAVADAQALLIATPEYNQSFPGVLKNALDWLSRPPAGDVLERMPVALMGATMGRWGTRLSQAALRQTLHACGCVVSHSALYLASADSAFDAHARLANPDTIGAVAAVLHDLNGMIEYRLEKALARRA